MRKQTIFLLVLMGCLIGSYSHLVRYYSHNANSDLRLTLSTGGIQEVDVLDIPATVTSRSDNTAETLEFGYHAKLELRGGALLEHLDDLAQALARTECNRPLEHSVDLRTAIIFFGPRHERIKSFYYGLRGVGGQINGAPCKLSLGLYQWVQRTLPD